MSGRRTHDEFAINARESISHVLAARTGDDSGRVEARPVIGDGKLEPVCRVS